MFLPQGILVKWLSPHIWSFSTIIFKPCDHREINFIVNLLKRKKYMQKLYLYKISVENYTKARMIRKIKKKKSIFFWISHLCHHIIYKISKNIQQIFNILLLYIVYFLYKQIDDSSDQQQNCDNCHYTIKG